ncbi:insoluble domain protein [Rhodococcus sp. IEGM 1307]|uniref:insoluble domain protein n=1 Tax=Rhodococcus sp. IEGM 1307 TaxID=3047091 RepID=UPI0024B659E1|nr:insoluble domain protein [Rhodococcus sp. IEGM 1307]MDI9979359.1 insoluble domain protein [Rhodococcus sp. IEGM 1307]
MPVTNRATRRHGRHRRQSATQTATTLAVITAALASGLTLTPSALAEPIQGGVTGESNQEGVTGGDTQTGTATPIPAPEPANVPETRAEPVYWVDPPATHQNIEYQPLPNYDYETNAYVAPEDYYVAPVQFDQLHLPTPVEPTKPFIAPRDTLRLGELHIKQPNWVSDMDRDRTNNTMAVVQAGVSTGWRSIGVETSRADRIAAAQVGAGAAGAALGAVTAGSAAATAGALVGGTIGGLAGMTAGTVFLPGLGWVPAGIVGTAAGAGIGAAAAGIPAAAAGALVGGGIGVAAVTPIAAGDKGEPKEIDVPDIDSEAVTVQTETVLTDWQNSGPIGQAAASAVQDTVESAPAIDHQARDFVAAQPGGQQIIEQVDTTMNSFFNDATPGLAANLLSGAIGGGIATAN